MGNKPTSTKTPLEQYDGIYVKREDLYCPGFLSGKLRGLLPYLTVLKKQGVKVVVNAASTSSNSHATVGFACQKVGLECHSFVNSNKHHLATQLAEEKWGANIHLLRPMHLGPLCAKARAWADEHGAMMLPWGYACKGVIEGYAKAVAEVPGHAGQYHVVAMGSGGWTSGIWYGLRELGREDERVVSVPTVPAKAAIKKIVAAMNLVCPPTFGEYRDGALPQNVRVFEKTLAATPFPSDPLWEYLAWGVALKLAERGKRVVFWTIGTAHGEKPVA